MKLCFSLLLFLLPAAADEGMWLYNQFPKAQVKERYQVDVTDEFLDHLRLSSVRLGGGSASFVSPRGLIFTNHHVAQSCISKVSSADHDYIKSGFSAATPAAELKCPDTEANVLLNIDDVTARVKGAIKEGTSASEAVTQRRAAVAQIEKECTEKTGNRCDVITLFSGERYDLYQYKRYTDIRLVFAPEFAIAFFGGDPDNFTYPRYDLDITFMRAYENGQPANTPNYLKWSATGAKEGDLVFVSGHPGTTSRLLTNAQLAYLRDSYYPPLLARLQQRIDLMTQFGTISDENKRIAQRPLFGFSNSYKGSAGKAAGLSNERLMMRRRAFEKKLKAAVERDPKLGETALKVWDEVAEAYKKWAPNEKHYQVLESSADSGSALFTIARDLIRIAEERAKPNEQRLPRYRDSARRTLELSLFSPAPIHTDLEIALLAQYFDELRATLGAGDSLVKNILAGRKSLEAAEAIIKGTKLADVAARRALAASPEATAASGDTMLRLARLIDEPARKLRRKHEEIIEAVDATAAARIAAYRFQMFGANDYPDATGTLRLAFGAVKGYKDKAETAIPWATTFGGLYHHASDVEPFKLPGTWLAAKSKLDLVNQMNFVSTADITGGNSGSPTINTQGEVVGIIFDNNIESLPNIFLFTDEQARAVHVASQGIVEALRKVYQADAVLTELGVAK